MVEDHEVVVTDRRRRMPQSSWSISNPNRVRQRRRRRRQPLLLRFSLPYLGIWLQLQLLVQQQLLRDNNNNNNNNILTGVNACTICNGDDEVLDRNAVIEPIRGFEFVNNCGVIQDLLSLIEEDGEACTELRRAMKNICGCPTTTTTTTPCWLCPVAHEVAHPGIALTFLAPEDVRSVSPGLSSLVEQFSPTCQLLDAYLQSVSGDSDVCDALAVDERGALRNSRCACCGGIEWHCSSSSGSSSISAGEESEEYDDDAFHNATTATTTTAAAITATDIAVITDTNATDDNDNEDVVELCIPCRNPGDMYGAPDRDVTGVVEELGLTALFAATTGSNHQNATTTNATTNATRLTCEDVFETLSGLRNQHPFCIHDLRKIFWGYCDCPHEGTSCREYLYPRCLDEDGQSTLTEDFRMTFLADIFALGGLGDRGFPFAAPTCLEAMWLLHGFENTEQSCMAAEQFTYVCGCNVRPYLGADTHAKQAWLAWLPRISGLMSTIGSALILRDLLGKKKDAAKRSGGRGRGGGNNNSGSTGSDGTRRSSLRASLPSLINDLTVLQQIVFGMSVFDLCSSFAFICSTLPIPAQEDFNGLMDDPIPSGVYGAKGNIATCKIQGFLLQLGYTGAFYNLALSVYYYLVIKHGYRESKLQKLTPCFHLPALVTGFGLAFAGIPFYDDVFMVCTIPPAVNYAHLLDTKSTKWIDQATQAGLKAFLPTDSQIYVTIFSLVPIAVVFGVGTVSLAMVYWHVRKQDKAAERWRMNSGNTLSSAVFWQFVFYTLSFMLCWPIYYVANFWSIELWYDYGFWAAALVMYPLQGFWNAVVYFRPRVFEQYKKQKKKQQQQQKEQEQNRQRQQQQQTRKLEQEHQRQLEQYKADLSLLKSTTGASSTGRSTVASGTSIIDFDAKEPVKLFDASQMACGTSEVLQEAESGDCNEAASGELLTKSTIVDLK